MKTLIVFESTHGSTEKCALKLQELLRGEVDLVNLKYENVPEASGYDRFIIGGSIHSGMIQSGIRQFCSQNKAMLKRKDLGLYLCCMEEGAVAQQQFQDAYPEELRRHSLACGLFGGEFNFDKMNSTQKLIAGKVSGLSQSVSKIKHDEIIRFVSMMDHKGLSEKLGAQASGKKVKQF